MKHAIQKIYLSGIAGAGMCGLAEVFQDLGYQVSGSDLHASAVTKRLNDLGIKTFVGHAAENLQDAECLVVSTAIKADNPEVIAAKARGMPVVRRAELLNELMRLKKGIAVAGTHGKTSTTSMLASVLAKAGLDPTFVIGGKLLAAGANAKLGQGEFIVVEADESDASFLSLLPIMVIITNIDEDHMDTYDHDLKKLHQAFIDFVHRMPFYGTAVVCIDDAGVQAIVPQLERPILRYGTSDSAQIRAVNIRPVGTTMQFEVLRPNRAPIAVSLNAAGDHNVRNALSTIAVAYLMDVPDAAVLAGLAEFGGVGRRFQNYGDLVLPRVSEPQENATIRLIDDYGHHPVEMHATLAAVRGAFPGRRLVLVFQPHRYSRTRDCFEDFVAVLATVDVLILTEVYAAGETPIVAADGRALTRAVRVLGKVEPIFIADVTQVDQYVLDTCQGGDVVITMGAGSVGGATGIAARLSSNSTTTTTKQGISK